MFEYTQIIANIVIVIATVASGCSWVINRLDKKFEALDKKFEAKFEMVHKDLTEIKSRLNTVEERLTVVETILAMMGAPIRHFKNKDN